ncbi:hypothetical protein [Paraburkholderia sp. SIMBA_054]|uniref:hypothetical protein n=1 Tax=Paraburkholderia sp. SIMBA_054 TaxID=3085795 RepID=UPI00397C6331
MSHSLSLGTMVRVVDAVKSRYFEHSEQSRRGGWIGHVSELTSKVFPDYVRVDFELRPRQRRQRLKEFIPLRDLEIVQRLDDGVIVCLGPADRPLATSVHDLLLACPDAQIIRLQQAWKATAAGDWEDAAHWLRNASKDGTTQWHTQCAGLAKLFSTAAKEASTVSVLPHSAGAVI